MAAADPATQTKAGAPFCPRCGTLLSVPDNGKIQCGGCAYRTTLQDPVIRSSMEAVLMGRPRPLPEWQKVMLGKDTKSAARPTVDEVCPKCGHNKMYFFTMQMRSADEGQTVFYECVECSHTFSVNA